MAATIPLRPKIKNKLILEEIFIAKKQLTSLTAYTIGRSHAGHSRS